MHSHNKCVGNSHLVPEAEEPRRCSWDRHHYPLFTCKETKAQKDKLQIIECGTDGLVIQQEDFLNLLARGWTNFPASSRSGPSAEEWCSQIPALNPKTLHGQFSCEQEISFQLVKCWILEAYLHSITWSIQLAETEARNEIPRCMTPGLVFWDGRWHCSLHFPAICVHGLSSMSGGWHASPISSPGMKSFKTWIPFPWAFLACSSSLYDRVV